MRGRERVEDDGQMGREGEEKKRGEGCKEEKAGGTVWRRSESVLISPHQSVGPQRHVGERVPVSLGGRGCHDSSPRSR